jgi:hypothetical protein
VRRATLLSTVLLLATCNNGTTHEPPPTLKLIDAGQADYTFSGCLKEDGPLCPRSATLLCAIDLIRSGDDSACMFDDDCELVDVQDDCVGLCGPVAVGGEAVDELRSRIQGEVDRYCTSGTCSEAGCDAGLAATTWVAVCENDFCQRFPADAGVPDASSLDAGGAVDATAGADAH